jgi:hypothetical protein
MNIGFTCSNFAIFGLLLIAASDGYAFNSYGTNVNSACAPSAPFTGDCSLCHTIDYSASTPAKTAYLAGGDTLTGFFCAPAPTPACTDNDNDSYAVEGGDCGPIDCDDNDAAINPGAVENCGDSIDNNCNGQIDDLDPAAVGCLVCTDADGDSFNAEGGDCGPVDCNDANASIFPGAVDIPNNTIDENCDGADAVDPTSNDGDGDGYIQADDCNDSDPSINPGAYDIPNNGIDENCDGTDSVDAADLDNDGDGFTPGTGDCDDTDGNVYPGAVEICTDGLDNNCDGLVDSRDPEAIDCETACTDFDGDTYAIEGAACGPVDCNDNDAAINPGSGEICGDGFDNDCDGSIEEGCESDCPDLDGDGFPDAACGGTDCDDTDAEINPGALEVCGNGVDENCNGSSDDACLTCPDGTLLVVKKLRYNKKKGRMFIRGRASVGTEIRIEDTASGEILSDNIKVRKGKWRKRLKHLGNSLHTITVTTSNDCSVDESIESPAPPSPPEEDRDDDDDREHGEKRDDDDDREHGEKRD